MAFAASPSSVESTQNQSSSLPRLLHLQILRALAALLVVVDHTYNTLFYAGSLPSGRPDSAYILGHVGVSAFFVLSGFIMMRQSADRFGSVGAPLDFAWHRLLRIVPMYWIATALAFLTLLATHVRIPNPRLQLALSLLFFPNLGNPQKVDPILEQGWTLNFEMAFYLLFTFALFLPRKRAVPALAGSIILLVLLGTIFPFPPGPIVRRVWHFYTHWRILLFAAGVALGFLEIKLGRIARWTTTLSPAWLLLVPTALLLLPGSPLPNSGPTLKWFSVYGLAVVVLCTLVRLDSPGRWNRLFILLGDASYCIYLFHLWAVALTVRLVATLLAPLHLSFSPAPYVAVSVILCSLLGVAIHRFVERPITRALRNIGQARKLQPQVVSA